MNYYIFLRYFDTYTLPEAESFGIRSFFRDVSFEQQRPHLGGGSGTEN